MYSVLVLMSTYNGEAYLKEQLDSILAQKGVEVNLLVRDDGSKDSTVQILQHYSDKYSNIRFYAGDNLGFIRSFSDLMKEALKDNLHSGFYAFADQDDIWVSDKLYTACTALMSKDATKPLLFTCNSMKIDSKGKELGLFHEGDIPVYQKGNVLVYGTEQGCSMTFNRKALEIYTTHEPEITYHDRWLFFICYYLGDITYEHRPLFYYRIHEGNALGKIEHKPTKGWEMVKDRLYFYFMAPPVTRHQEMATEFYNCFQSQMVKEDRMLFMKYISYRHNLMSKLYLMFNSSFQFPFGNHNSAQRRLLLFNKL